jgi:hypothetical protein
MMKKEQSKKDLEKTEPDNKFLEGNDKAPGEERGKGEKVTLVDLKGKTVDGDPEKESDKPISIN